MIEHTDYIEPALHIKEENFDVAFIPESDLILEIGFSYLRFTVKHQSQYVILEDYNYPAGESIEVFLSEVFNQHVFLVARFWKSINVLIHSKKKTVVPAELDEKRAEQIWKALFGQIHKNDLIKSHAILDDQTLIYLVNKGIVNFLRKFYTDKKNEFQPVEINLLPPNPDTAYLLYDGIGYLFVSRKERISSYYSLNYNDLVLDHESSLIKFIGEITKYSDSYKSLKRAGFNIEMTSSNSSTKTPLIFRDLPRHRYYSLIRSV
ncbi:MAG: hypothetical protein ACI97P_001856 [Arcticibacterium sp.]